MTITFGSPTFTKDYQGLCNTIADTLNRPDLLTAIPNFVALATERIQRDIARVKHPAGVTRTTLSATSGYVNLPADFLAINQLLLTDTSKVLAYISPDQSMSVMSNGWGVPDLPFPPTTPYQGQTTGPTYYTVMGLQLRLIPVQTVSAPLSLDLFYYGALPAIDATSTTNWVLTRYPDLYLYGALVHSAPYLKADQRLEVWESAYQKILADIEVEADRALRSQSKLVSARKSF